jgi:hypothetical protein
LRLPFPDRVSLRAVFWFAAILCGIQQLQRTNAEFSLACFFFILLAGIAFNVAGGFHRPSGSYVFFYATLTVIVGLIWKAVLGEPADSNLSVPLLTISVYLVGMCMMLVSIFLSRRITLKRAILGTMITDANMQTATVGCMITGILMTVLGFFLPGGNGSVTSGLNQINRFLPLAVIFGVIHTIRRSGGTRSINLPVLISGGYLMFWGLLGFSKEGIITPFICWLIAASSQRYKVTRVQMVLCILATVFIIRYLVPYSQYGRMYRGDTYEGNLQASLSLLSNLEYVREQYVNNSADSYEEEEVLAYYNTPQGFFDRLQELSIDDALINRTVQYGPIGIYPIIFGFENLVPHFIWKDKPTILYGNVYAHEIGLLSDEDNTTGVSFSPTSEAYHLAEWTGLLLIAPPIWICLFTLFDSLCGDSTKSPWGLLVMLVYSHIAPEAGISGLIYAFGYTTIAIVFAAVFGAYVMPVIGTFFIGPEGIILRRGAPIRSAPKALSTPSPSEN